MRSLILAVVLISSVGAACDVMWPNNTDTALHWWQCDNGPLTVYNCTPFDTSNNYEYPVHLTQPLVMEVQVNNPTHTYTAGNLKDTILIWEWNRQTCAWVSLPTFGLLSNQDSCSNGMPCPIKPGKQWLPVTIDFTPYKQIIQALQDNMPYQLHYLMNDKVSGDQMCIMFQARAYVK